MWSSDIVECKKEDETWKEEESVFLVRLTEDAYIMW
jgi:hypothetical protein